MIVSDLELGQVGVSNNDLKGKPLSLRCLLVKHIVELKPGIISFIQLKSLCSRYHRLRRCPS